MLTGGSLTFVPPQCSVLTRLTSEVRAALSLPSVCTQEDCLEEDTLRTFLHHNRGRSPFKLTKVSCFLLIFKVLKGQRKIKLD